MIYFLFSFRTNKIENKKENFNTVHQIFFTNKYNLPLLNQKTIPNPLLINEDMIGFSIETILRKVNFNFEKYLSINKNTLQKKFRQITTVGLIPKPKYIKWYPRNIINKQHLRQVAIPSFLHEQIINILQLKIADPEKIINKLEQTLTGIYLKYFNIIKLFCVF